MSKKKKEIPKQARELLIIGILAIGVFFIASRFDLFERIYAYSRAHEELEIDELLSVTVFLVLAFTVFMNRRMREFFKSQKTLEDKNKKLEIALAEIKQLEGIIPICSSCKKIRDDEGYWERVETYIEKHSDAEFSHGLCPDCAQKLYPGYLKKYADKKS